MNSSNTTAGHVLQEIDFKDFPNDKRYPQIDGKLFIADNLDSGQVDYDNSDTTKATSENNDDDERKKHIASKAPVKLAMTVIFICVEGQMRVKVNLQEYLLTKSTAVTIITGAFLQLFGFSKDFKGIVVAIAPQFLHFEGDIKTWMAAFRYTQNTPFFKLSDSELTETLNIYLMMKQKLMRKDFHYRSQIAKAYLDLLRYNGMQSFYEKHLLEENNEPKNRRQELFMRFLHTVHNHYRESRQVIFYADKLSISPKYLSTIIHEVSGKYATEWIDEYIILDAKAMLKWSRYSVKEICSQLHFANQSLFSKYFKHHTGMTPKEFRNAPI